MTEAKHTPGPWQVDASRYEPGYRIWDTRNYCLASIRQMPMEGENKANAHLIAAAPELLEACLSLMANGTKTDWPSDADIAKIDAAIAKATGAA